MSAPVIERRAGAPGREQTPRRPGVVAPGRIPAQRGTGRVSALRTARRSASTWSAGTQRARDQRDDRLRRVGARAQAHAGRAKFVLLVMTLLAGGLVATLWLSTAAAADSYRLQGARSEAKSLTEQSEQLRRQVSTMNSPAALAQRASALGLVPVQDPARLVVAPDGRVDLVGEPTAAQPGGPTPPSVPGAPAPAAPAVPTPAAADTSDTDAAAGATTTGTEAGRG